MPRPELADDAEVARHFRGDQSREEYRAEQTAKIPGWYSPWVHLAGTTGIGVGAIALAALRIKSLGLVELATVPAVWAVANLFEWHAHRNMLHRRRFPWQELYDRHTPVHHRIYRYGDMEVRSMRELRFVLIPAIGVLGIVVLGAPVAALVGSLLGPNVGWLFLAGEATYVVAYELTHLAYHLPKSHPVQRIGLVRWLSEHHGRHHDPRLMQRWNFNVTVPLADWLFGTIAPEDLVAAARNRAAAPAPSGAEPAPAE